MADGTVNKQVDEALIGANEPEDPVDSSSTPQAQEPVLESLGTWSMDQDDLERDVAKRAEEAMAERDKELDQKRLEKTKNAISRSPGLKISCLTSEQKSAKRNELEKR